MKITFQPKPILKSLLISLINACEKHQINFLELIDEILLEKRNYQNDR